MTSWLSPRLRGMLFWGMHCSTYVLEVLQRITWPSCGFFDIEFNCGEWSELYKNMHGAQSAGDPNPNPIRFRKRFRFRRELRFRKRGPGVGDRVRGPAAGARAPGGAKGRVPGGPKMRSISQRVVVSISLHRAIDAA